MLHVLTYAHNAVNLAYVIVWNKIKGAVNGILRWAIDVPDMCIWHALLPQFHIF